jgi:hypothetical protein
MSDRWRGSADLEEADIELLERLGAIADIVDPVPDHVREMGRALFAFRDPDAELMQVVELDGDRLEAVRGSAPTSRLHFFEFGELSLDLELTVSAGFYDVVGVLEDPDRTGVASVTLETMSAAYTTLPDEDGRLEVRHVPSGMVRISIERSSRPKLSTPWFDVS